MQEMSLREIRQLDAEADAYQADADAQRRVDAIVLTDPRVVALVEAVFSAQANARNGFDTLASADWDAVLDNAKKLTPRGWDPRWREKLRFVPDCQYWAVRTPDQQHYLDENGEGWLPMPQAMGGWFLSLESAKQAANKAGLPPGNW